MGSVGLGVAQRCSGRWREPARHHHRSCARAARHSVYSRVASVCRALESVGGDNVYLPLCWSPARAVLLDSAVTH
eukprot:491694-Prymnesium_polylepis.1